MHENPTTDERLINADEIDAHFVYVMKALNSERRDVRERELMEGFLNFGTRFAYTLGMLANKANHQGPFETLSTESRQLLLEWMQGKRLTQKADENDRRAQMAMFILEEESGQLGRLAAKCIMALPEGHPQRDIGLVHRALLKFLALARTESDFDGQVLAIKELIDFRLEGHDQTLVLIQEGLSLIDKVSDPGFRHDFRVDVVGYYISLAIDERDNSRIRDQRKWARKAKVVMDQMSAEDPEIFKKPSKLKLAAAVMELSDSPKEAARLFAAAVDSTDPSDTSYKLAATIEARYRIRLKDYQRVIKVLSPIVKTQEHDYLTALYDEDIVDAGVAFSTTVWSLAFAHAHLGIWDQAVMYLERAKSLRFRYTGALRQIPSGKKLLKLERKLYALSRGVPVQAPEFDKKKSQDWLGAGIPLKSKIVETYRARRPKVSSELLASPSIGEMAKTLTENEAVVTLGVDKSCGTMMVVICKGDNDVPTGHFLWKERTLGSWIPVFAGEAQDGWLYALCAPELNLDGRPGLTKLLKELDRTIGRTLGASLKSKKIRRVTIVPHLWFHLVPFWTLRSLEKYEVTMAASIAHFMQSRSPNKGGKRKALVVADPTRDLPATLSEADSVESQLSTFKFNVLRLERESAMENSIVKALRGVSIFHFCGHGRADSDNPSRSTLLVYPDLKELPVEVEPFEYFSSNAQEWRTEGENERSTLIPNFGRLYELEVAQNQTVERRIEYGERGTLWGRFKNGALMQVAEMWTAGDILVEGSLRDCRLVFLSACEAGGGSLSSEMDEYAGLPAALQLAGASTIICSLWPVSDALTALFVDMFYKALTRGNEPANIVAIVQKISSRLRRMNKKQATSLLNGLRRRTSALRARFILEAYAAQIKKGKQLPFSHPYDWGAFYVTGASTVYFPKETTS